MQTPALKISKTDVEPESVRHQLRCSESFSYFLRHEVKTTDPQEGIYQRPMPDWHYIYETADAWQINQRNVILKSRQLMLSWILAAYALWLSLYYPPSEFLLISKGGRYSRAIGERVEYIFKNLSFAEKVTLKTNAQYGEYIFPGIQNNKIICLPADEDVTRTFSPSAIGFDEAAFFPFAGQIMSAIGPQLERKVKFICLSTPNGKDQIFYPMWHQESGANKIALHYSQRPDRGPEWVKDAKNRPGMTPQQWAREYEHSFATPAGLPVFENWNAMQAMRCFNRYDPAKPLIRGFDRGFESPACLWAQVNLEDQLMGLHELQGNHIARDPWLKSIKDVTDAMFPNHKGGFLGYGAADFLKPESDGIAWKKAMENYGIYIKAPGGDDIDRRVTAVRNRLPVRQDGKFGIIIDPDHCPILVEAMGGAYHMTEHPDGQGKYKPVKDEFSHLADCLEHICDNHWGRYEGENELVTIRLGQPPLRGVRKVA